MDDKEATREELEAVRDKMLNCLNGLLWHEACEVALNVFGFVAVDNDVDLEDAIESVREYYKVNGGKGWAVRGDH
jgi:hypothetical protein